jgi:hypothetical protein
MFGLLIWEWCQGASVLITIPSVKLIRRLGRLPDDQFAGIEQVVKLWLGFGTGLPVVDEPTDEREPE